MNDLQRQLASLHEALRDARHLDADERAALGAAVLIALQLIVEHWFYLYIPWFAGFLFLALLARQDSAPESSPAR